MYSQSRSTNFHFRIAQREKGGENEILGLQAWFCNILDYVMVFSQRDTRINILLGSRSNSADYMQKPQVNITRTKNYLQTQVILPAEPFICDHHRQFCISHSYIVVSSFLFSILLDLSRFFSFFFQLPMNVTEIYLQFLSPELQKKIWRDLNRIENF